MDTINNTSKIEIKPYELKFMNDLKKEYNQIKIKILNEIIEELIRDYKLLKKES